jgi:hypothetical protein
MAWRAASSASSFATSEGSGLALHIMWAQRILPVAILAQTWCVSWSTVVIPDMVRLRSLFGVSFRHGEIEDPPADCGYLG